MKKKVLLAGESWTSTAVHIKGWDQFPTVTHHRGADAFVELLAGQFDITYMLCHEAVERFPNTAEALDASVEAEVAESIRFADASPEPTADLLEATTYVGEFAR